MNITSIGEILFDIYPNHKKLGGAPLNFIYNIKKLTDNGNIISRVGKDILGNKIINELQHAQISSEFIQQDHLHPTGMSLVSLDKDKSPHFKIEADCAYDFIELNDENKNLINLETDCLYFGTLAQRSELSRKTIQYFFNSGIKYFADLNLRQNFYNKEIIAATLLASDFIKVSYEEMHVLNDVFLQSEYSTEHVAFELMEKFNLNMIAVTRGEHGSSIFENGKRFDHTDVEPNVVDTTGAGDAFAAILCLGYLSGLEIPYINKLANDFASEICLSEGALPKNERIYEGFREQLGIF
jgi:fructokinase